MRVRLGVRVPVRRCPALSAVARQNNQACLRCGRQLTGLHTISCIALLSMRICAGVKLLLLASITFFFSAPVTSSVFRYASSW